MLIPLNLRHLEDQDVRLEGELALEALELEVRDEMIEVGPPLKYDIQAAKQGDNVLIQGDLELPLRCHCVRCLQPFSHRVHLKPWTVLLPLSGEESVRVIGDCVDLTAYIREDILLAFPQHPLCKPECGGLPKPPSRDSEAFSDAAQGEEKSSAWAELNKLKF